MTDICTVWFVTEEINICWGRFCIRLSDFYYLNSYLLRSVFLIILKFITASVFPTFLVSWLLREAVTRLEGQGKAVLFPGTSSEDEGVKFAEG